MSEREPQRPDVDAALSRLEGFQRAAVEVAFDRLYRTQGSSRRFLIADEVGLGKTLIARGVVARAIDHLWDSVPRIDVVYVCSNASIARQNVRRLGFGALTPVDRLTLLPVTAHELSGRKLNFIACTPGTSFDLTSQLGIARERRLLFHMMQAIWPVEGSAPMNLLQGTIQDPKQWRSSLREFSEDHTIDCDLQSAFHAMLEREDAAERERGGDGIRARWEEACHRFRDYASVWSDERVRLRSSIVSKLRSLLARSCIGALQPDLVILDEFQRFRHLIDGADESEASELARRLFEWQDAHGGVRVLLLSATPYKMYTLSHEAEEDDHHRDFLRTVEFLQRDQGRTAALRADLDAYRREMYRVGQGGEQRLPELQRAIEGTLRLVMSRTERTGASGRRDGMIRPVEIPGVELRPRDLLDYVGLQRVARAAGRPDVIELWKSAPYLLSFADDYALKRNVLAGLVEGDEVLDRLRDAQQILLEARDVEHYAEIDPANARLRGLLRDVVDGGLWRCLWLPPSMPSHALAGPFEVARGATKRLVFSAWHVVPRAIAALVSYEVERRAFSGSEDAPSNSAEARKRRKPLLRFSRSEGRLTGMPVLGLLVPSAVLAKLGDPRDVSSSCESLPALDELLNAVEARVAPACASLVSGAREEGPEDEAWYWAAPILLDLRSVEASDSARNWWSDKQLAAEWTRGADAPYDEDEPEADEGWEAHVAEARDLVGGKLKLGRPPADLPRHLARLALGGPATAALRALWRCLPDSRLDSAPLRFAAARIARGVRSLFNRPEATAIVRVRDRQTPYWRKLLDYCCEGALGDVLDEYLHLSRDLEGLFDKEVEAAANALADLALEALTLRAARQEYHAFDLGPTPEGGRVTRQRLRGHFAMRFGTQVSEADDAGQRADQVRAAFNSPFWPFVLASTSVGQEGLDFHAYCHAVVHWNLPANPVDLEQREGRVHRYKGHAIRKNVAQVHGDAERREPGGRDPWKGVFDRARPPGADVGGLIPFWVFEVEGGSHVERRVPALPLSRDAIRLEVLRQSLAVYRMVFGQPRQDDLLAFLSSRVPEMDLREHLERLRIDLSPGSHRAECRLTPPIAGRSSSGR